MKKVLFSFLITALALFTACSSNDDLQNPIIDGEEIDVTITADVPSLIGATAKSTYVLPNINSAKGGVNNVDPATHQLRYILEITDASSGTTRQVQAVAIAGTSKATFTARLVKGATYKFVAWADFTLIGTPLVNNHYNADDLGAITLVPASALIVNDDTKDAYYGAKDIITNTTTIKMTLKRPFMKVRLIATDYDFLLASQADLKSASQLYTKVPNPTLLYTEFNAKTGAVATALSTPYSMQRNIPLTSDDSNAANEKTLYWDYLFVPTIISPVAFNLSYYTTINGMLGQSASILASATALAAVKENTLVTIRQAIFSSKSTIEIEVDDNFDAGIDLGQGAFSIGSTYYATIADAIAATKPGETINVAEGTFTDDFTIPAGVTVEGKGSGTVFTGVIAVTAAAKLINATSYYNGTLRCAVELKGENIVIDGVTFITDKVRKVAPAPYNGEAMHGDNTVKNLIIQNCSFNTETSKNYWKGVYLNRDFGLQVLNNKFYFLNPFGMDNFDEGIKVEGNEFHRSSTSDINMIDLAVVNIAAGLSPDPTDPSWPAGLIQTVKDIKDLNTWHGTQIIVNKKKPVRVNGVCYGGEATETWTQFK